MHEPVIQWGAIAMFVSILLGWVTIHLAMQWQEHKRRRVARGFRNMRSTAHHQRERARARWGEHHPTRSAHPQAAAKRNPGWR